jgi:hypothetical protein
MEKEIRTVMSRCRLGQTKHDSRSMNRGMAGLVCYFFQILLGEQCHLQARVFSITSSRQQLLGNLRLRKGALADMHEVTDNSPKEI